MNIINFGQKPLVIPQHRSIWDIPSKYHLSILGLCLSENEMLFLSTGTSVAKQGSYCRFRHFAKIASAIPLQSSNRTILQQLLDRKYQISLLRFAKAKTSECLEKTWNTCLVGGQIRGAYWSLMTHSLAASELQERVYQQLNIFSLQSCCLHLQEKMRNCELQKILHSKEQALAERERLHNESVCQYCSKISELKTELVLAEHKVNKMERILDLVKYRNNMIEID